MVSRRALLALAMAVASAALAGQEPIRVACVGDSITFGAGARDRVLHVTQPPFIIRPQYWIDGRESMACWTDYPASGWGTCKNPALIGLSVPTGEHELVVKDMRFPRGWPRPFTPAIPGVATE